LKIGLLATLAVSVLLNIPLHAGNLVTNPGFETGDLTGWTYTPAACGPLLAVGSGGLGANSGNNAAQFGGTCAGSYDVISQVLPTVAGDSYVFSFWLASNGSPDGEQAFWDGNRILDLTNFIQPYMFYSFTETASTSSTTIAFGGYNVPAFNGLDDISVSSAVPEPSSMILLGLGSAMLLVRRRKARA
jgi:PEP-CTERM motif